jgi:hypothetical protein
MRAGRPETHSAVSAVTAECPSRRAVSVLAPVFRSHSRIVLLSGPPEEPDASRPSGSAHSAATGPKYRAVSAPVFRSHSRIVLSKEPDARRPSGSTHSVLTGAE